MERLFPTDVLTKRERVEAALNLRPVDRVPILEQLSYNPRVIADWTGRAIEGFDYALDDICAVIRQATDLAMPPVAPRGTDRYTTPDGSVYQNDNWTTWRVARPFHDVAGARDWMLRRAEAVAGDALDPAQARAEHRLYMTALQQQVGETVILKYHGTGFCAAYDAVGLELFAYVVHDHPDVFRAYMEASAGRELAWAQAVADRSLSPVILIAEDFATKRGPIFAPEFLRRRHYPYVERLAAAWHAAGVKVLYHSDGNYRRAIPDLIACGVDGFYCLEPGVGMDIVELKRTWPGMVWSGGVDGVDLMERGTLEQVRAEVRQQIIGTDALSTGGLFVASSSEINPPIPPESFRAMVEAVGEMVNPSFAHSRP
jgi:Uroporphyrinogen decarboxylase (URO-D)